MSYNYVRYNEDEMSKIKSIIYSLRAINTGNHSLCVNECYSFKDLVRSKYKNRELALPG